MDHFFNSLLETLRLLTIHVTDVLSDFDLMVIPNIKIFNGLRIYLGCPYSKDDVSDFEKKSKERMLKYFSWKR